MTQEEKKVKVEDAIAKILEAFDKGFIDSVSVEFPAKFANETIEKLQAENEQLKAKLEKAKKSLNDITDLIEIPISMTCAENQLKSIENMAIATLKEIE